jgi:peptide-methionine (S)-S-oxide reductase
MAHTETLLPLQLTLPGRPQAMTVNNRHAVNGNPISGPFVAQYDRIVFALGCFWGAERKFWQTPGVVSTAVGYAGGNTPNPTYEEVCSGRTNHTEVIVVFYDAAQVTFGQLLTIFWEAHNPTQGMRQGNDRGTQYRSAIYANDATQLAQALASRDAYDKQLHAAGFPPVTTEIALAGPFYYAEDYHQQYLHKNPGGYCGLGGTGVRCVS